MEQLTPQQLKITDTILEVCDSNGTASPFHIFGRSNDNGWGWEIDSIMDAAEYLKAADLIKPVSERVKDGIEYMFTSKGEQFYKNRKLTIDFINDELEKETKQLAKEEREEKYKELQMEEIITRLNTMNPNQLDFWKAQKQKNRQTTLIAIISAIFSLIALMKTWGFFD